MIDESNDNEIDALNGLSHASIQIIFEASQPAVISSDKLK